jgi:histidyl-tRNA synthetase
VTPGKQTYQKPRGFSDILPAEVQQWQEIEQAVHQVFQQYGYRELRPPIMEHTELFARSIGETTDIVEKEMFTIEREDGKNLSLRPEITASLCRSVLEHHLLEQEPFQKFYYIGPSFRYEKPQKGRQRQFHQIGVEALGGADPLLDLETIQLIEHLFDDLGIDGYELHLNSMGCPECRPSYRSALKDHLRPRLEELCDNCERRFDRNVFRVLDCKRDTCREHSKDVPHIYDHLCEDCDEHWNEFIDHADRQDLSYRTNPRLVRGLDYYTRTVYEFRNPDLGAQNALGGGGRYDGLIEELGGDPTPGIGFALGIERMLLSLAEQEDEENDDQPHAPDAFFVYIDDECKRKVYNLVQTLRGDGFSADLNYEDRSVKAQMRVANRSGAPFVCILGPDELEQNQITVKEMESGDQEQIDLGDLEKYIS